MERCFGPAIWIVSVERQTRKSALKIAGPDQPVSIELAQSRLDIPRKDGTTPLPCVVFEEALRPTVRVADSRFIQPTQVS